MGWGGVIGEGWGFEGEGCGVDVEVRTERDARPRPHLQRAVAGMRSGTGNCFVSLTSLNAYDLMNKLSKMN